MDKRGIGLGDSNSIRLIWVKPITAKKGDLCLGPFRSIRIGFHSYRAAVLGLESDRNESGWGHLLDTIPDVVYVKCALQPGISNNPAVSGQERSTVKVKDAVAPSSDV